MDKKVFINEEKKVITVVLYNREYEITARGKSVCCDQDTFDKDLGLRLANTRAWKDYYSKLAKEASKDAEWYDIWLQKYQADANKVKRVATIASSKLETINKEYQDMLSQL